MFTPAEMVGNYADIGVKKVGYPIWKMLLAGAFAGLIIGMGAAVANTATFGFAANPSAQRDIAGLLFPFGLGIIILTGMELFTGNCLICISVLERKTSVAAMLRNWLFVYLGNFIGAVFLAVCHVYANEVGLSNGDLAVATIRIAAYKCGFTFGQALTLGVLCNVMVCLGVLVSLTAKDTMGRIAGAFIPVAFFIICGYEHSVANMYYVTAGLFANSVPGYAALAAEAGVDTSGLNVAGFMLMNLLPVTLGNIIGGVGIGASMWALHLKKSANK